MSENVVMGLIVNEDTTLTLAELSHACRVHAEWIVALVEEGILEPQGDMRTGWHFSGPNLRRARMAVHLQQDLGVNLAGAALALDLMDELESLRRQVAFLDRKS
ncbi:hypothetical protein MNBD_GAMMA24-2723 [hydrothermal vent metagenome]|uniref:MerR family transcriptional regulator n=1 Tax=hydrothermal vent metagenome TaxID=652676 RepID=A0A3B1BRT0_9ZZZZ